MILKISGALMIVSACFYIGNEMANSLKQRSILLDGFVSAVSQMQDYIEALSLPLDEIYTQLALHIKSLSGFFSQLADSGDCADISWKSALSDIKYLNDSDRKILLSLASTLGQCDKSTQLSNLRFAGERLFENLTAARQQTAADAKMYRTVSLFTGIGIAVLII